MKLRTLGWPATVLIVGVFSLLTSGCVVPGGGYGYPGNAAFGVGYYEPVGVGYGGWGHGYDVGPVRGGESYEQRGGHRGPSPRPIPSIPWHGHASGGGGNH